MQLSPKTNPLHELMVRDVSLVSSANCVLARLWRLFLYEVNVTAPVWESLLLSYTNACKPFIGDSKASNLKGNLPKRLSGDQVTWDKFCEGISVFNFEDVIFSVTLTDENDVTKEISVRIPRVLGGEPGTILAVLWDKTNKAFPEKLENWHELLHNFIIRCKEAGEEVPEYLKGNLTRALSGDKLMWLMFHRGLIVHVYKKITIVLKVKQRKKSDYQVVRLNLTR